MKKILILFVLINIGFTATYAQEENTQDPNKAEFNVNADLVSRYIWRGMYLGGAAVQPIMEFSKGGFAVGAVASYSFNSAQGWQETDLYVSYIFNDYVNLTLIDYFAFDENTFGQNFFDFDQQTTPHTVMADLTLSGGENIPFSLLLSGVVYGLDAHKLNGDLNYSTYAELAYDAKVGETALKPFLGVQLNAPGDDIPSFYGNKELSIINLGLKAERNLKISEKVEFPLYGNLILNPALKNFYLVLGIAI